MTEEEHKEKIRKYMKDYHASYYKDHKDEIRLKSKSYYHKTHPDAKHYMSREERRKERARRYRKEHHEEYMEYQRRYRSEFKYTGGCKKKRTEPMSDEKAKEYLIEHQGNRSYEQIMDATGRTYEDLKAMYDEYVASIPKDPLYHQKLREYYAQNREKFREANRKHQEKIKRLEKEQSKDGC